MSTQLPAIKHRTYKNSHKEWVCETIILLREDLQLKIYTTRSCSRKLTTHASVGHIEGNSLTHMVFRDFSRQIASCQPIRVTQKLVEEEHFKTDFLAVITEANEFYKLEEKVEV